jgi:hypothetical protein
MKKLNLLTAFKYMPNLHSYSSLLSSFQVHIEAALSVSHIKHNMLFTSLTLLALVATGLAQVSVPAGYRRVYIASKQDTKFVIVPKTRTAGATLVV